MSSSIGDLCRQLPITTTNGFDSSAHIQEDQISTCKQGVIQELRIKHPDHLGNLNDEEVISFLFGEKVDDPSLFQQHLECGNESLVSLTEWTSHEMQDFMDKKFDVLKEGRRSIFEFLLSLTQDLVNRKKTLLHLEPSGAREERLKDILRAEYALNCHKYAYFDFEWDKWCDFPTFEIFDVVERHFLHSQHLFSIDDKIALLATMQICREHSKHDLDEYKRMVDAFKVAIEQREEPGSLQEHENQKPSLIRSLKFKNINKYLKCFYDKAGIENRHYFSSEIISIPSSTHLSRERMSGCAEALKYENSQILDLSVLAQNKIERLKDKYFIKFVEKDGLTSDAALKRINSALELANYVLNDEMIKSMTLKRAIFKKLIGNPKNSHFVKHENLKGIQTAFAEKVCSLAFKAQRFIKKNYNAFDSSSVSMESLPANVISKKGNEKPSPIARLIFSKNANVMKGSTDEKFALVQIKPIGEGEFNDAHLSWMDSVGMVVSRNLKLDKWNDPDFALDEWNREVVAHRELFPFLKDLMVKHYDIVAIDKLKKKREVPKERRIILEQCEGDLSHFKLKYRSEEQLRLFGTELCKALKIMHEHQFLHGDLKPNNILYVWDEKGMAHVKLADFGKVLKFEEVPLQLLQGDPLGAPVFRAPESFFKQGCTIPAALDMWSLGLVFYALREDVNTLLEFIYYDMGSLHALIAIASNPSDDNLFKDILEARIKKKLYIKTREEALSLKEKASSTFENSMNFAAAKDRCQTVQSEWISAETELKTKLKEFSGWKSELAEKYIERWMEGESLDQVKEIRKSFLSSNEFENSELLFDQLVQEIIIPEYQKICDQIKENIEQSIKENIEQSKSKSALDSVILGLLTTDIEKRWTAAQALEYLQNQNFG